MTFSLVVRATDPVSGEPMWGVAVASRFLAVGSAVPAAVAGIGAIATQAEAHVGFKAEALAHLDEGATAAVCLDRLLEDDPGREHRQVGLVDCDGGAATYTGSECFDWAGGVTGPGYAAQGNILTGPEVVESIETAWLAGEDRPVPERLLAALAAGDAAGGDRRGRQSAALLVVREGAGYGGHDDVAVDLRVDDHADPIMELARLLDLNGLYLTASTVAEQVPIDAALGEEIGALVGAAGHPDLAAWVGTENYEMRVDRADPPAWIDVRVLEILRQSASSSS